MNVFKSFIIIIYCIMSSSNFLPFDDTIVLEVFYDSWPYLLDWFNHYFLKNRPFTCKIFVFFFLKQSQIHKFQILPVTSKFIKYFCGDQEIEWLENEEQNCPKCTNLPTTRIVFEDDWVGQEREGKSGCHQKQDKPTD